MQVFSDSADLGKFNNHSLKPDQTLQNQQIIAGSNFQKVLQNHLSGAPVESAMNSTSPEIKKKKKDTEEIMEDYSEIAEETYDALTAEKKIRDLFRKLRLGEKSVKQ